MGSPATGLGYCFRLFHVPDISPIKHSKLMYSGRFAACVRRPASTNGKLLSIPEARALFFSAVAREIGAILSAAGNRIGSSRAVLPANGGVDSSAQGGSPG